MNQIEKKSEIKDYKYEIVTSIISLLVGVLFSIEVLKVYNANEPFPIIVFSICFAVVLETFLLLLRNTSKMPHLEKLLQSVDRMNDLESKVRLGMSMIDKQNKNTQHFIEELGKERFKILDVRSHLYLSNEYIRDVGTAILTDYYSKFQKFDNGFYVEGSQWALRAYSHFWNNLVEKQKLIGKDIERCIIARITHSNDVGIWIPDSAQTKLFLSHQRKFIEYGGIIVRIFIGNGPDPNERYKKAMGEMKAIGIVVRYFDMHTIGDERDDFMYIHDLQVTLRWYSAQSGKDLSGFSMVHGQPADIKERWRTLFHLALDSPEPITEIPPSREFS
jgi:hypothetical protein